LYILTNIYTTKYSRMSKIVLILKVFVWSLSLVSHHIHQDGDKFLLSWLFFGTPICACQFIQNLKLWLNILVDWIKRLFIY